jgi:vesicle-associated membrane protein 7
MAILYAMIARQKVVLAEHTAASGSFPAATRLILNKIPPLDGKMSYVVDEHVFHYLVALGVTYLCMAEGGGDAGAATLKRRVPFAFLEDVRRRFVAAHGGAAIASAAAFALNTAFAPVLKQQMAFYNDSDADAFGKARLRSALASELRVNLIS